MKQSKRYKEAVKSIDKNKTYSLEEAISVLKNIPRTKFDETVEVSFNLELDPKRSDQIVRGTVVLPHGTGKKVKIAVFCKGEDVKFARESGADFVGGIELIEKIQAGWLEFDVGVSTPEMMKDLGRLGKILGPRGLMPNAKAGTVNSDIKRAITDIKGGKIEFKMDKTANIHVPAGKISFEEKAICENVLSLFAAVARAKPMTLKGRYVKSIFVSTTMGPGIRVNSEHKA